MREVIDPLFHERLWAAGRTRRDEMVAFAQQLVQTRSSPGEEQAVAELVLSRPRTLGFAAADLDAAGNVVGVPRGSGAGRSVQFNAHLDHVHEGDSSAWRYPPYAGVITGGVLYGRGASDVKGAVASQVYGHVLLRDLGLVPAGDCSVTGVVQAEVGGAGAAALCQWLRTDVVVLGEATNLELRRGHRGRVGVEVRFISRSAHASAPERGVNPLYALGCFLCRIDELPRGSHPELGHSSVAPTLVWTDRSSANVIPGVVRVVLDWRTVPGEDADALRDVVEALVRACAGDEVRTDVTVPQRKLATYRGLTVELPPTRGFVLPVDHLAVTVARSALEAVLVRPVADGFWRFATDGGHFMARGMATIGFAPGDERLAHTVDDSIRLVDLEAAMVGYAAVALTRTSREEFV